jgi:thiol-disulfide isomerase/thioredoxin
MFPSAVIVVVVASCCVAIAASTVSFGVDALAAFRTEDPANKRLELTDATFVDTVVSGPDSADQDFLVFFYAPWCGHCKSMKPLFEEANRALIEDSISDSQNLYRVTDRPRRHAARFAIVDATANDALAKAFRITSFPTFYYFIGGQGYLYNGGRDVDSFRSFARHLGIARHYAPMLPVIRDPNDISRIEAMAPTRALFLFSEECLSKPNDASLTGEAARRSDSFRATCLGLARATLFNVRAHFLIVQTSALANDASVAAGEGERIKRIAEAFRKASPGPNGERLVGLSEVFRDKDAVPFNGSWNVGYPPEIQKAIAKGPGVVADEAKRPIVQALWNDGVGRFPQEPFRFVERYAALPVETHEGSSMANSMSKDTRRGLVALLLTRDADQHARASAAVRHIAQERNLLSARLAEADPKQRNAEVKDAATDTAAPAKGTMPPVPPAAEEEMAADAIVSDADLDALPPAAAAESAVPDDNEGDLTGYLSRPKAITIHATIPAADFMADFGLPHDSVPTFVIYWPKHVMVCPTPLDPATLGPEATDEQVTALQTRVREALDAADRGDFSRCIGRDWPAAIVHRILTRPFPSLDEKIRQRLGLGNLELIMCAGCALLVIMVIPLSVRAGPDQTIEARRRQAAQLRQRAGAAGAAAAAAVGN